MKTFASIGRTGLSIRVGTLAVLAALGGFGAACAPPAGKKAAAAVEVGYVEVQPTTVALTQTFSGRVVASESSEVRPQVSGLIQKQLFAEGAMVRAGQPLYQIDPSLYRAALGQAQANLVSAQANAQAADELVARYKPLAAIQAVSAQDYTNAVAASRQAAAAIGQAKAAVDTASINLRFATVPAPIGGRIGRSLTTVGGLVTSNQAAALTTIQRLDPIFIDVQQSSADFTRLRRQLASGAAQAATTTVQIHLEDGSLYPHPGVVTLSEVVVDPNTGALVLRVRAPNPDGLLLPGMYLQTSLAQARTQSAFLAPQGAISRDPTGKATLWVVGPDGKSAVSRTVTADRSQGAFWVVTQGLAPGDKIITQGVANLRPGRSIRPVLETTPQRVAPPVQGNARLQP